MPENRIRPMTPAARHNARHYALQAVYQWQLSGTPVNDIEAQFIAHQITKQVDLAYFKELLHGILSHQQELDNHMKPHLNRSLLELDPIELAVLRLAIYEIGRAHV